MSGSLHLRGDDLRAMHHAMGVLLQPSVHATLNAWRAEVNRSVQRAVGADNGLFVIRAPGIDEVFSEEQPKYSEYVPASTPWDTKIGLWQRQEALVVWSRPILWGKYLRDMYRSAYYHDFVKIVRGFDTIGLSIRVSPSAPLSSIHVMHGSERGMRFGERGLSMLRLLEPPFRVGMTAALSHFGLGVDAPPVRQLKTARMTLTPRQTEIAQLLAMRRSNREIAERLGISRSTAKRHTEDVLARLGLTSRRDVERVMDND